MSVPTLPFAHDLTEDWKHDFESTSDPNKIGPLRTKLNSLCPVFPQCQQLPASVFRWPWQRVTNADAPESPLSFQEHFSSFLRWYNFDHTPDLY